MMKRWRELSSFGGVITALVTPFRDGTVDFDALAELVDWQIRQGVRGLVACGTTGESPTLSHSEWQDVIRLCVGAADGRVPVIAGSGTNNTRRTIELTNEAVRLGADAALIVTPYYNKPSQEGLFRHFESIERSAELPLILYNVPSRTGVDLGLDTLERLAGLPGIVGLKDATGDLSRVRATMARLGNRFVQLGGHDRSMLDFVAAGGDGAISVISNVAPMASVAMINAQRRGDLAGAHRLHLRLLPLLEALDMEINPCAIKFALHCLRGLSPSVRLPLVEVNEAAAMTIRKAVALVNVQVSDRATAGR